TGRTSFVSLIFSTAASTDTVAPVVESISPPPGSRLLPGNVDFLIRFSEPVQIAGVWSNFSSGGQVQSVQASFPGQGDGQTVIGSGSVNGSADARVSTLELPAGITDLAGNPLSPISFAYTVASADEAAWPQVKTMKPAAGTRDVPRDASIELR